MVCYERLKRNTTDKDSFKRLHEYLQAIEEHNEVEYHKKRGR